MRLFVAVDPPPPAVRALDEAIGDRDPQLRWVPPEQWHLTLVFCGEVDQTRVPELCDRLGRAAARSVAFPLRFSGVGTFPKRSASARVVWVGVDGDVPALTRLAERCSAAARRTGIDIEDRSYRPHLSVARARRDAVDARSHLERLAGFSSQEWTVSSVRLVHSTLGAKVRHETLDEFALATYQA